MKVRNFLSGASCACLAPGCLAIFASFDPEGPPAYCTVYTHLPKSGGSSLKSQLQRQSVKQGLPKPGVCAPGDRPEEPCLTALHDSTIIAGYGENLRNALADAGRDCEFFTMMRHPIDRAISAFYYCPTDHDVQNRPAKWCGGSEGQQTPLSERFVDYVSHEFLNRAYQEFYSSFICKADSVLCKPEHGVRDDAGRPRYLGSKESWEILEKIKVILESYTAVGIFEEWNLSMQLFDARVKSPIEHWDAGAHANPGEESPTREALRQWAHDSPEVHNLLLADMLVYAHAIAIFEKQTAKYLGHAVEKRKAK